MSGLSAFLYMDLMELAKDDPSLKSIPEEMKDQYSMREINSQLYVGAFADIKVERRSLAAEYGVFINGKEAMPFMTVNIPVKNYVSFLNSGIADYIEIGEKNYPMMDNARTHTKASIVQSGGSNLNKGYCGKDVIVGVIDIGFDYTHRNLYDSTETTYRVKRVWDQNGSGTPPQGYNYGHLYTTQASILAARYSHNNQTHGMHVVGMAAGGGTSESAMRRFKGMAPESDIVLVATTMSSPDVLDGLRYILAYADSVGKPCVVNMSLGNHVGPHDGKDANEINTDYLFEEVYTEGAALLVSAGNEGSDRIHLSKNFTAQDSSMRTFAVKSDGSVNLSGTVDIWGTIGNNFRVKIAVVDSTSSTSQLNNVSFPLTISTQNSTNYLTATVSNCTVRYYAENSNYNNQKTHVYLSLTGSNLSGRQCMLIKVEATSGTVHMWNNSGKFIGGTAATPGNTNYTSNNKASGNTSIMVASYNTKAAWTTYTNASYNLSSRYPIGGRSYFSSIGPGLNPNQNKPEIAAPGALICSSYNKYDSRYNTSHYMITHVQTTGSCWWGMMQGTSMACPAATGIVALWMEAYPDLSYSQVKYLLRTTAITDSNTGSIPVNGSPQWGWGKINALAGLQTILQKTAKPTVSGTTQFCPGSSTTLSAPTGYAQY
ncbi:MAG: S8 family serine peptidase, partial [Bacteroidales bacterium]|nr:S8 family serine peptidase [Bacteroidales bacterium]